MSVRRLDAKDQHGGFRGAALTDASPAEAWERVGCEVLRRLALLPGIAARLAETCGLRGPRPQRHPLANWDSKQTTGPDAARWLCLP